MAVIVSGAISIVTFFGAEWLAECFTDEPEVVEFAAFSIRCMAVALILDNLSVLFQHYLQGINERKIVNIINFASRFFIPVITAFVLGMFFGSKGIMASIAVSEFILIALIAVLIFVRTGSLRNFMLLPEKFGGEKSDNIYASITSADDVMSESLKAEKFCLDHGVSGRNAKLMALFVEETAGNIIAHGKPKLWHKLSADYRLSLSGGKICMTLRDCCGYFDPEAFYSAHKDDSPENMSGMKIVMGLADDVRYFNAFNSNNIMIYLDAEKGARQSEGH
jgi:anti-sigma regulatory factor (Ser/Thr protein kinase)